MKYIPILFSTPMVQAIMEGRKTQTRRVCKHQYWSYHEIVDVNVNGITQKVDRSVSCPYGKVGDVLWVREGWAPLGEYPNNTYMYKADTHQPYSKWKPSIHMPKEACRIFLEITNIRVERLQDISDKDAIAEGIERMQGVFWWKNYLNDPLPGTSSPTVSFCTLWQSINGKESLKSNPWVWVIEFKRIEKPDNFLQS